jgi:WD40 repeat protein
MARDNDRLAVLSGHDQPFTSIAFSPNGDRLISGGEDKTIRVWNPVTGDLMLTLRGQDSEVESLGFSPDGSTIVAVYADGAVWSWHSMQAADP